MYRKFLLFVLISVFLSTTSTTKVEAYRVQPKTDAEIVVNPKKLDTRALVLKDYLAQYNSPLQYHAQDFIDAADAYKIDWKLVPAIAGVESTFGKATPGGFNGWGWGVYGTQALYFDSWRHGIFTVSKGLRENYYDKGLKDPYSMNRIYAASPTWGSRVSYFLDDIETFEQKQNKEPESLVKHSSFDAKTMNASAKLSLSTPNLAFSH